MHKKTIMAIGALVLSLILVASVSAAWGGEPDGDGHPMVGALFADFDGDGQISGFELICSGSYAGPSVGDQYDVFLTAGHCLPPPEFGPIQLWVSFDNELLDDDGPADLIPAAGFVQHPGFNHDFGDLHDLGVVLLPANSVIGIDAVQLPPAGFLDDVQASHGLRELQIELVGYGVVPFWRLPRGTQFDFTGERLAAEGHVKALTKSYLWFNQNENARGPGGLCFGDSGSPQFLAGSLMIVSTTSGGDVNCRANNYNYRLDTQSARDFLGQFIPLP